MQSQELIDSPADIILGIGAAGIIVHGESKVVDKPPPGGKNSSYRQAFRLAE